MSLPAFHLSFAVPDLRVTARFYVDVLGCALARDEGRWIDLSLQGHQLTLHQSTPRQLACPLDHFGLVMDAPEWHRLARRIEEAGVGFVSRPRLLEPGSPNERGKFLVRDPAGNLLEFKSRHSAAG